MNPSLWKILDGKKTTIAASLNLLLVWVIGRDMIATDTVTLVSGMLTLWTVVAIGHKVVKAKK